MTSRTSGGLDQRDTRTPDGQSGGVAWHLRVDDDGVATLTLDVPGKSLNVLTAAVMKELNEVLMAIGRRVGIRYLVIKSGKPGNFIAGADLNEIAAITDAAEAERKSREGQAVLDRLEDLAYPTVALIDGAALGGGLEIALACDYRVTTDHPKTKLGLPETSLGIIPGFGGTYRLPATVGRTAALQIILSAKPVDGLHACRIHLSDRCVPSAFATERTREFMDRIVGPGGESAEVARRRRSRRLSARLLEGTAPGRAFLFSASRRRVLARSGRNYPALIAALTVLQRGAHLPRESALALERKTFGSLAPTDVCRNLIRLFFEREAVKRSRFAREEADDRPVRRAAVLGAGTMGGRIAWLFTKYDIPVAMKDIAWKPVEKGFASALDVYRTLASRGRFERREVGLKMHHLSGSVDYASLADPDFIVEAVVEDLNIKRKVLAELESHIRDDAIVASNTSSLSIGEMARAMRHPERFVGMHFFNPPNRMPLVEIIRGEQTDPRAVRAAFRLALRLGKTPVPTKDSPGFLVNRLLMPYLNEALHLAADGVDYQKVDEALIAFGMPMGPFRLLDEIGIDVAHEVARVLGRSYGSRLKSPELFDLLFGSSEAEAAVTRATNGGARNRGARNGDARNGDGNSGAAGRGSGAGYLRGDTPLGRKSGSGFYVYRPDGASGRPVGVNSEMQKIVRRLRSMGGEGSARGSRRINDFDLVHRPVLSMVNEAARALEEGVAESGDDLDLALVMGIGFPPFRGGILRYADTLGIERVRNLLEVYSTTSGERFEPAPLIADLAETGGRFHRDETPTGN